MYAGLISKSSDDLETDAYLKLANSSNQSTPQPSLDHERDGGRRGSRVVDINKQSSKKSRSSLKVGIAVEKGDKEDDEKSDSTSKRRVSTASWLAESDDAGVCGVPVNVTKSPWLPPDVLSPNRRISQEFQPMVTGVLQGNVGNRGRRSTSGSVSHMEIGRSHVNSAPCGKERAHARSQSSFTAGSMPPPPSQHVIEASKKRNSQKIMVNVQSMAAKRPVCKHVTL